MLESMRKYHQSIFIYIVFGLLILVFGVNFGPGSTGCNPSRGTDYAAVVNGETDHLANSRVVLGTKGTEPFGKSS